MKDICKINGVELSADSVLFKLSDGRQISVPNGDLPEILWEKSKDSYTALDNYELIGGGLGIRWPDVDVDISLDSILHPEKYNLKARTKMNLNDEFISVINKIEKQYKINRSLDVLLREVIRKGYTYTVYRNEYGDFEYFLFLHDERNIDKRIFESDRATYQPNSIETMIIEWADLDTIYSNIIFQYACIVYYLENE